MTFSSLISIQIQWRRSRKKSDHAIWGLSGWLLTSPASTLTTLTSGPLILQSALKGHLYESSTFKHHIWVTVTWYSDTAGVLVFAHLWTSQCEGQSLRSCAVETDLVSEVSSDYRLRALCLIIREKQSGGCTLKFWITQKKSDLFVEFYGVLLILQGRCITSQEVWL